ncbi:hypothetical protein E2562_017123 [Oryza meyeriana var. granulata]|uniref:Uncharacterized protein n=1 Tax=Oryza meyeriana var. granulata TaxID=110450 RepID=A0A6G1DYC5_9ORYZ|nr:hypothetical protein E2562_017123 [Oryza meyeriana var. granulata]
MQARQRRLRTVASDNQTTVAHGKRRSHGLGTAGGGAEEEMMMASPTGTGKNDDNGYDYPATAARDRKGRQGLRRRSDVGQRGRVTINDCGTREHDGGAATRQGGLDGKKRASPMETRGSSVALDRRDGDDGLSARTMVQR